MDDDDYDEDEISCDLSIEEFFEAINPENPYYRARAAQRKVDHGRASQQRPAVAEGDLEAYLFSGGGIRSFPVWFFPVETLGYHGHQVVCLFVYRLLLQGESINTNCSFPLPERSLGYHSYNNTLSISFTFIQVVGPYMV